MKTPPEWALEYLTHLDKYGALGVDEATAHDEWPGDPKIAEAGADLVRSHVRRAPDPPGGIPAEDAAALAQLRADYASMHGDAAEGLTPELLEQAYQRGAEAWDESPRVVASPRSDWGRRRANAFATLAAGGRRVHPDYTADDDLLPEDHPVTKAEVRFVVIGKRDTPAEPEERYALGPVLIPDTPDLQGDIISAEEITKAERAWMARYQNLGVQHAVPPDEIRAFRDANPDLANGRVLLVESQIVRSDSGYQMINGRRIPAGTWLIAVIYQDPELWAEVKAGKRTGFSIGGLAKRTPVEPAQAG